MPDCLGEVVKVNIKANITERKRTHSGKVCTWGNPTACEGCGERSELHCRTDTSLLSAFAITSVSTVSIHIFGLIIVGVLTGIWWPLIALIGFLPIFFIFIEGAFLCSHCPFWAEDSRILHCLANNGTPKLFPFKPYPMKRYEKIIISACFLFLGTFSIAVQVWFVAARFESAARTLSGALGVYGVLGAGVVSMISFFTVLKMFYCSKCINFSCPFNGVPKDRVDAYLEKNHPMKDAWEKAGYTLGPDG